MRTLGDIPENQQNIFCVATFAYLENKVAKYGFSIKDRATLTQSEINIPNVPQMARRIVEVIPPRYHRERWANFVFTGTELIPDQYKHIRKSASPLNPEEFLDLFDELAEAEYEK